MIFGLWGSCPKTEQHREGRQETRDDGGEHAVDRTSCELCVWLWFLGLGPESVR